MDKSKKKFRVNALIIYDRDVNTNNYRPPLLEMMRHIAWLYRLDYAISEEHPFSPVSDSVAQEQDGDKYDLIYFRSNDRTRIQAKDLRKLIDDIFYKSGLTREGVEIGYQLYRFLPKYPFPKEFYRPLNYPYMEVHSSAGARVCIPEHCIYDIISDEQQFDLN